MNSGDIVAVDVGTPIGSKAGFVRPAAFLRFRQTTVFAVPLTSTKRAFPSHVEIEPDTINQLEVTSYALVEQMRAVATERCGAPIGNVGPAISHQVTDVLAMIIGMPLAVGLAHCQAQLQRRFTAPTTPVAARPSASRLVLAVAIHRQRGEDRNDHDDPDQRVQRRVLQRPLTATSAAGAAIAAFLLHWWVAACHYRRRHVNLDSRALCPSRLVTWVKGLVRG